ncbi:hypothetical protein IE53DRAFT_385934 [Violaceomyces palustris]|uniref:Uncharacterized protein n=1 Tax=Violaceomyces palustris TaxID=1673888 RepID=A0ACD0P0W4_9BASI|nr:hypothetical protein IE53DRAFT_385934 [Violaceomyces palustris]
MTRKREKKTLPWDGRAPSSHTTCARRTLHKIVTITITPFGAMWLVGWSTKGVSRSRI